MRYRYGDRVRMRGLGRLNAIAGLVLLAAVNVAVRLI